MTGAHYISVILPLKLEWEPCYALPDGTDPGQVGRGDRVKVMFANREYSGVISATGITPDTDPGKIKPILYIEKDMEKIFPEEIKLWRKVADYYLCTVGEVYKAAYPYGKINLEEARAAAKSKVRERREKLLESIRGKISRLEVRLEKKKELLAKARKESVKEGYAEDISEIEAEIGRAREALEAAGRSGLNGTDENSSIDAPGITLSEAQNKAFSAIQAGFKARKPVLLHGVTGSGKTEIYMKLAHNALSRNRNVLYLVPEIALSRQLEDRLYEYFGERLMVFHSAESAASKRNVAERIRTSNEGYIVLGTRSSLFLPHHDLGLIIVDEEHENTYKQQDPAPRYHARNAAIMLASMYTSKVLLGTATPSVESYYNATEGKYGLVELKERYQAIRLPRIEVVDIKELAHQKRMQGPFSPMLVKEMREALERKEQVILFQNRRGFAPMIECHTCGWIPKCKNCDVSLTYHKGLGLLTCHYCGYTYQVPRSCPACEGVELNHRGFGTERIEDDVKTIFPEARVARMDLDTAKTRTAYERIIADFQEGQTDILIGTQMISKGLDFDRVSVVGILNADTLLNYPDFRSHERAFQLMAQVAGRAGRKNKQGLVILQTKSPDLPVVRQVVDNDFEQLYYDQLAERQLFRYPPYYRLVYVYLKHRKEEVLTLAADMLANHLRTVMGDRILGPDKPPVARIQTLFIKKIVIKVEQSASMKKVRDYLLSVQRMLVEDERFRSLIVYYDVDPQ